MPRDGQGFALVAMGRGTDNCVTGWPSGSDMPKKVCSTFMQRIQSCDNNCGQQYNLVPVILVEPPQSCAVGRLIATKANVSVK